MSYFYAYLRGAARTKAIRRGTKSSGLTAYVRTYTMGVRVVVEYDARTNTNHISIFQTGGLKKPFAEKQLCHLQEEAP